jgi:hypothetical protein
VVTRPDEPLPPELPPQDDPARDPDARDDSDAPVEVDIDELRVKPEDEAP